MKVPQRLTPLVEEGLVDEVLSQLMSGKEATVYVVRCGDSVRCAKVYKKLLLLLAQIVIIVWLLLKIVRVYILNKHER